MKRREQGGSIHSQICFGSDGTDSDSAKEAPRERLKFSYKEQREFEQIDGLIEDTESKLVSIQSEMETAGATRQASGADEGSGGNGA